MFDVHLLPADHGDCIWIDYGEPASPSRILIDAGTAAKPCYQAFVDRAQMIRGRKNFELLVVTHIDDDHIGGVLKLLKGRHGCTFDRVWFNAYAQLSAERAPQVLNLPPKTLSAKQGEDLAAYLLGAGSAWNEGFEGKAVKAPVSRPFTLPGGMRLTVIAPTSPELSILRKKWVAALKGKPPSTELPVLGRARLDVAKLAASDFVPDTSPANGSSIVILAEYDGKRCLLAADGHADVIERGIKRLVKRGQKALSVDAFKVPHHGSRHNVSGDLIKRVKTKRYLVSTNGNKFSHPHREAIARIIQFSSSPQLHFNYRSPFTRIWDDDTLRTQHGYSTRYPEDAKRGLTVQL